MRILHFQDTGIDIVTIWTSAAFPQGRILGFTTLDVSLTPAAIQRAINGPWDVGFLLMSAPLVRYVEQIQEAAPLPEHDLVLYSTHTQVCVFPQQGGLARQATEVVDQLAEVCAFIDQPDAGDRLWNLMRKTP